MATSTATPMRRTVFASMSTVQVTRKTLAVGVLLRKDGSAEEMDGFDDQDFDAQNEDVDMPE